MVSSPEVRLRCTGVRAAWRGDQRRPRGKLTLLHVGGGNHLEVGGLGALLHTHALAHQGGAGQTKDSGHSCVDGVEVVRNGSCKHTCGYKAWRHRPFAAIARTGEEPHVIALRAPTPLTNLPFGVRCCCSHHHHPLTLTVQWAPPQRAFDAWPSNTHWTSTSRCVPCHTLKCARTQLSCPEPYPRALP